MRHFVLFLHGTALDKPVREVWATRLLMKPSGFSSVGSPLSQTVTNLNYTTNPCPNDGYYSLVPSTGGCFGYTWHTLGHDHTGNPNGYMMVINATDQPSTFYTQRADGSKLCPNTTYEFAAWILNILVDELQTAGYVEPNITFSIEKLDGTVLKTYNTGDIKATSEPIWKQYGTFFTSPSDGSDVIVKLTNNASGSLGNDFVLDDITFKPCGPVIETGFGTIGNTSGQSQCANINSTYTLVAAEQGFNSPSYQWQINVNDSVWVDIAGATGNKLVQSFTNPGANSYQYRVGILNGNATSLNCRIYSQPLSIVINPYPIITFLPQTAVCEGSELALQSPQGDTYEWTGPNGFTSAEQSPIVTSAAVTANNGLYSLKVTKSGCPSFATTTVTVFPQITSTVSGDVAVCQGGSTPITVQSNGGLYYKWMPSAGLDHDDQPTVNASPAQTTTYSVIVNNGGCYTDSKSVTVTVLQNPYADAGSNKTIMEGNSVMLNGTAKGDDLSYYWTPANNLDNANSLTPIASPVDNTTYTLHVVSDHNCGESDSSVFVRVFKTVKIPNTFTPNNDGINDYWNIYQLNTYPESLLTVFDRYGQKVYQSIGYPKPWDGMCNKSPLPTGTYYYIIDLKNNIPKMAGWVLIVR